MNIYNLMIIDFVGLKKMMRPSQSNWINYRAGLLWNHHQLNIIVKETRFPLLILPFIKRWHIICHLDVKAPYFFLWRGITDVKAPYFFTVGNHHITHVRDYSTSLSSCQYYYRLFLKLCQYYLRNQLWGILPRKGQESLPNLGLFLCRLSLMIKRVCL